MLRFALLAFWAILFSSCLSEPDCVVTASSEVKISFLKSKPDSVKTETADTVILDSIRIAGSDSVFYVGDTLSSVILPINVGGYETTLFFYLPSQQDSLKIAYTRSTRVISPSCGAFNYFQDLAVVSHSLPSVTVVNPQLSNSDAANLIIRW